MKINLSLAAVALSVFAMVGANAQTTATSPTRAEVKAEAASAVKAGETNLGERATKNQDKSPKRSAGMESRDAVKADAKTSAKTAPKGEEGVADQNKGTKRTASMESRDAVKADTKAAVKAGTVAKGEEAVVDQNKGKSPKQ